jgi:hypothetical protein
MNKHRMNKELSSFAARLRALVLSEGWVTRGLDFEIGNGGSYISSLLNFGSLALELFALQFENNAAYRKICEARLPRRSVAKAGGLTPKVVEHWTQIPAVPTSAFKELELSCIPPQERTAVFHSSGTTEQKPSRHFHNAESLAVYESSLWNWFEQNIFESRITNRESRFVFLTPPPAQAPHSSLVHMLETARKNLGGASVPASRKVYLGKLASDGLWTLDFAVAVDVLSSRPQTPNPRPVLLFGTAFSFVHLLDFLAENNLKFQLPENSRVVETGGYKNRSRSMPKAELHALITERLGVLPKNIICEYGMSELSSQAYDSEIHHPSSTIHPRVFRFPPWSRVQIISPETRREVADGETGLICVFDLANVFSVMAVQTEDLGVRRGDGFELIGRAQLAEPRGCSLMTVETCNL